MPGIWEKYGSGQFETANMLGWMGYNVFITERKYRKTNMLYRKEFGFEHAS